MEKRIPRRRFKEFVGSGDWEEKKLGEVADIYDGTHQTPNYTEEGIMFLSVENIKTLTSNKYISKQDFKKDFKVYPEKGDILMTRIGDVGTANVVKSSRPVAYYVSLALLKNNKLDSYFLKECIATKPVQMELWVRTLHIAFPKKINKNEIGNVSLSIPSLAEQEKIGNFFQKLDRLIEVNREKLDKLKASKSAYLAEMFPGEGEDRPRRRFKGFTGPWEEKKIRDIFRITRGNVLATTMTSKQKSDYYCYPVYSSQTLNNGLMGYYNDYLYKDSITWTTDGANAGTVKYRSGKFYCTNVCGVLLSNEGYSNKMVAEVLNKIAWQYVSKVGNPKLMNNIMGEIIIKLPSLAEQEKIGNFFQKLDDQIGLQEEKLEKLEKMKKAYLAEMFV